MYTAMVRVVRIPSKKTLLLKKKKGFGFWGN